MNRQASIAANTAALALVAATAIASDVRAQQPTPIAAPGTATVMQLSEAECKAFAGVTTDVIKTMGRANMSNEFVRAMIDFAVTRRCVGPYNIPTRGQDIAAFNSIGGILGVNGISLDKIGVRQVKPVAALTN